MPTYEYECLRCKHRFEQFQSIKDEPLKRCPKCRGKVQRQIGTGAGIIFKGSGFYATDYRSDGYKRAAKAEKDKGSGTTKSGSPDSSSSKPASSAPTSKKP
jgi:putative FmdB family regulatory protein